MEKIRAFFYFQERGGASPPLLYFKSLKLIKIIQILLRFEYSYFSFVCLSPTEHRVI